MLVITGHPAADVLINGFLFGFGFAVAGWVWSMATTNFGRRP